MIVLIASTLSFYSSTGSYSEITDAREIFDNYALRNELGFDKSRRDDSVKDYTSYILPEGMDVEEALEAMPEVAVVEDVNVTVHEYEHKLTAKELAEKKNELVTIDEQEFEAEQVLARAAEDWKAKKKELENKIDEVKSARQNKLEEINKGKEKRFIPATQEKDLEKRIMLYISAIDGKEVKALRRHLTDAELQTDIMDALNANTHAAGEANETPAEEENQEEKQEVLDNPPL